MLYPPLRARERHRRIREGWSSFGDDMIPIPTNVRGHPYSLQILSHVSNNGKLCRLPAPDTPERLHRRASCSAHPEPFTLSVSF